MSTAAQIAANQTNSKLSSGPKTEVGKAVSSQNNFRHGLSGAFVILAWENAADYDELLEGLRDEHQPATPTEALLVERLAQHWWLGQRALRLQDFCFDDKAPMVTNDCEKEFALYLRYQTTHEKAFHKCLADLMKLRAQQFREVRETRALLRQKVEDARKQELHAARLEAVKAKTELDQAKLAAKRPVASKPNLPSPIANPAANPMVLELTAGSESQTRSEAA